MRRESLLVPVLKKLSRGTCVTNYFRGMSLTSTVSTVLCMILNARLTDVAEEERLIVEEQGGFRKQRGCREQVLMLVLLGQAEMVKAAKLTLVSLVNQTHPSAGHFTPLHNARTGRSLAHYLCENLLMSWNAGTL